MINNLKNEFKNIFNHMPDDVYFSPGRINLIGEHIDYNGGLVFPLAINIGTYGCISKRDDNKVVMFSDKYSKSKFEFSLDNLEKNKETFWVNYVIGMICMIKDHTKKDINKGFNLYIKGNIPSGAGLSSSASLELLIGSIINDLNNLNIDRVDLALLGQKVENEFIKLNSGIMDQFAISLGKKDNAILLNTSTLSYSYAPFNLGNNLLVIGFTNKKRSLADSKYNQRYSECQEALKLLKTKFLYIKNLCELELSDIENNKDLLGDVLYKRARHVVSEQQRTKDVYQALVNNDISKVSKLLLEGHKSLQEDYEVTGIELDTLVYNSIEYGALGARQTGAGFGGCMIAIVPKDKIDSYISNLEKKYLDTIGYSPIFYIAETSDGSKKI